MVSVTKECVICKKPFEAKRSDAEVCSQACRQKNWRLKKEQIAVAANPTEDQKDEINDAEIGRLTAENETLKQQIETLKKAPSMPACSSEILSVLKEWQATLAETIPPERNKSPMGQTIWRNEQQSKISLLQKKLLNLKP